MSRHRNVRGMRYSDEYDGYDDVYGHSVEEDVAMSPSDAAFMFDRSSRQPQIACFIQNEEDIAEEDEQIHEDGHKSLTKMDDVERAKLLSCLDEIRNVLGDTVPEPILIDAIIRENFDIPRSLDRLLNKEIVKKPEVKVVSPKPQRITAIKTDKGDSQTENFYLPDEDEDNQALYYKKFDITEYLKGQKNFKIDIKPLTPSHNKAAKPKDKTMLLKNNKNTIDTERHFMFKSKVSRIGYYLCKKTKALATDLPPPVTYILYNGMS